MYWWNLFYLGKNFPTIVYFAISQKHTCTDNTFEWYSRCIFNTNICYSCKNVGIGKVFIYTAPNCCYCVYFQKRQKREKDFLNSNKWNFSKMHIKITYCLLILFFKELCIGNFCYEVVILFTFLKYSPSYYGLVYIFISKR